MGIFERLKWRRKLRADFSSKILSPKKMTRPNRRESVAAPGNALAYAGIWILWGVFISAAGYIFLFSQFLSVENIEISGSEKVSEKNVRDFLESQLAGKYLGVWPRNNFFAIRPDRMRQLLRDDHPLFKDVVVTRKFPDTLEVSVDERDALILWRSGGQVLVVEEDGTIIQNSQALSEENAPYSLFVTDMSAQPANPGVRIADERFAPFVVGIKKAIEDRLAVDIDTDYSISSRFAEELRIRTSEDWELYVNTSLPIEASLNALALLFEKELPEDKRRSLKYIDLRIENRVYYAFRDAPEQSVQSPLDAPDEKKPTDDEKKKKK